MGNDPAGNLGLVFSIIGDPTEAEAALRSFEASSEEVLGAAMAAGKATADSMGAIGPAARQGLGEIPALAEEAKYSMEQAHEGARLLEVMLGLRLPRAVSTAVGTMIPELSNFMGIFLGAFAVEKIYDWGKAGVEAIREMRGETQTLKDAMDDILKEQEQILRSPQTLQAAQKDLDESNRRLAEIGHQINDLQKQLKTANSTAVNSIAESSGMMADNVTQSVEQISAQLNSLQDEQQKLSDRRVAQEKAVQRLEADAARDKAARDREAARSEVELRRQTQAADEKFIEQSLAAFNRYDQAYIEHWTTWFTQHSVTLHNALVAMATDAEAAQRAAAAAFEAESREAIAFLGILRQIDGEQQAAAQLHRSGIIAELQTEGNQTKHLSAARKELIGITQTLKNTEMEFQQALHNEMSALEDTTQNVEGIAEQFAAIIGGTKAAAEVKGAFDAALSIEYFAQFIASYGTDTDALMASVQYGLAAAEMFKVSGGGGGGGSSAGGGGGGAGAGSSRSSGGGSNGNGNAGNGPGGGWNVMGPGAQTASPTINLHLNGQQFASVVVPVITQGVQNGSVRLTASTTVS